MTGFARDGRCADIPTFRSIVLRSRIHHGLPARVVPVAARRMRGVRAARIVLQTRQARRYRIIRAVAGIVVIAGDGVHVVSHVESETFDRRLRQAVTQRTDLRRQGSQHGDPRRRAVQLLQRIARSLADRVQHRRDIRLRCDVRGDQAAGVFLGRTQQQADRGHFGHRERAMHGVQRAQQALAIGGCAGVDGSEPVADGPQMSLYFGVEDFEQQRIDRGRYGLDRVSGIGVHRAVPGCRRRRASGIGRDVGRFRRCVLPRFGLQRCRLRRHRVVARGDARGIGLHRLQVRAQDGLAAQHRLQLRQCVERLVDHLDHGRARRPSLDHAVEQAFDRPAELAQRLGADQTTAALEGMEYAADRAHEIQIARLCAPRRQQRVEILDLARELLQEHLADLVVDLVADVLEAAHAQPRRRKGCRRNGFGRLRGGRCGDPHGIDRRRPGFDAARQLVHVDAGGVAGVQAVGRIRGGGVRLRFRRQRPVAQRLEAAARDVEDVRAIGALFAQGLEVVLQARQGVGEGVELAAVGHALARDQLALGIQPHAVEIAGGLGQLEDRQRPPDLTQQPRDFLQFGVVPAGLDERDERLAGIGEVRDRLAHQRRQRQLRFHRERVVGGLGTGATELGHLFVERRIDVQQRAGDIEQGLLARRRGAGDDVAHGVALLLHDRARRGEAEHAEGVGHPCQYFDLRLQAGDIARTHAQMQVQRILDPQQVFLDGRRDGVQQGPVATAEAAARMFELGFAGQLGLQVERLAQRGEGRVRGVAVGNVIEQLPGRLLRGLRQQRVEPWRLRVVADLALDAGEDLAQRCVHRGRKGVVRQRLGHPGGDPEHAPL